MELMLNTQNVFINKKLNSITRQIAKLAQSQSKNQYHLAALLREVDETKCFEEDGFKSVHDYALNIFGIKKTATYAYLGVAKRYMDEGDKTHSRYATEDCDFTVGQLALTLPLDDITMENAVEEGAINPAMSQREIKDYIKSLKALPSADEEAVEVDGEVESVSDESEVIPQDEALEQKLREAISGLVDYHGNKEAVVDLVMSILNDM